jgi:hypothetical protein
VSNTGLQSSLETGGVIRKMEGSSIIWGGRSFIYGSAKHLRLWLYEKFQRSLPNEYLALAREEREGQTDAAPEIGCESLYLQSPSNAPTGHRDLQRTRNAAQEETAGRFYTHTYIWIS